MAMNPSGAFRGDEVFLEISDKKVGVKDQDFVGSCYGRFLKFRLLF
jgi:hypothetical protein